MSGMREAGGKKGEEEGIGERGRKFARDVI